MNLQDIDAVHVKLIQDRISWTVNMLIDTSLSTHDYGHILMARLTADFARWPELGEMELRFPLSWWDHVKRDLFVNSRFRWLWRFLGLTNVKYRVETHKAALVLPNVTLPPELSKDSFFVWFGQPEIKEISD